MNNTFEEIWDKIKKSKNILMTLHGSPDGDSLGSCTAMKYFLERDLKKKVTLISRDKLSPNMFKLAFSSEVQFGKELKDLDLKKFDLFLSLDCAAYAVIPSLANGFQIPKNLFIINIDHHKTNTLYGQLNYVDSSNPSACSVLVDMFRKLKMDFDAELSTRLLLGVCTDSGFFTYDTNPVKSMEDGLFLMKNGGRYTQDILPIIFSQPLNLKKYFAYLINNLKFDDKRKCYYVSVPLEELKKFNLTESEAGLGSNEVQVLEGAEFFVIINERENSVKISFRSKKRVDVSLFASALGGGGHQPAAAAVLPKMPLKDAEKKVLEVIDKVGIHYF